MLFARRVPIYFWTKVAETATYLINKPPTRANLGVSPDEVFFRLKPCLVHLRILGCLAYAHLDKTHRDKLEPRAQQTIFLGYDDSSKAYRVYNPKTNRIIVSRDITFD